MVLPLCLYTGAMGKRKQWSEIGGGVIRCPPEFKEDHGIFNPEEFIKAKLAMMLLAMRRSGQLPNKREIGVVHDFMATGKPVAGIGGVEERVFYNKPQDEVGLSWFANKNEKLRRIVGDDSWGELVLRNVVGMFMPYYLGRGDWEIGFDWHMETLRLIVSPLLLKMLTDVDQLRELNKVWGLENKMAAGGVNMIEVLMPMLVWLASKQLDDGLEVLVSHKQAVIGEVHKNGRFHEIDKPSDVTPKMSQMLTRFAHGGFDSLLMESLYYRADSLAGGSGLRLKIGR